jgi:hypothetical protein
MRHRSDQEVPTGRKGSAAWVDHRHVRNGLRRTPHPIPARPNSIAHLVKRHVKLIMIHTVSKRSSDDAIQELNVLLRSQRDGLTPIVLACRDLRKAVIDSGSQSFGSELNFKIDDGRL